MIDFKEFQTALLGFYDKKNAEMIDSAFSKLDKNDDGYLDYSELAQILQNEIDALQKGRDIAK